jgi:hypothetical protein
MGKDNSISGLAVVAPNEVAYFLAATFDGEEFQLYADGVQVARGKLDLASASAVLQMAPAVLPAPNWQHFGGAVASLTLVRRAREEVGFRKTGGWKPKLLNPRG